MINIETFVKLIAAPCARAANLSERSQKQLEFQLLRVAKYIITLLIFWACYTWIKYIGYRGQADNALMGLVLIFFLKFRLFGVHFSNNHICTAITVILSFVVGFLSYSVKINIYEIVLLYVVALILSSRASRLSGIPMSPELQIKITRQGYILLGAIFLLNIDAWYFGLPLCNVMVFSLLVCVVDMAALILQNRFTK